MIKAIDTRYNGYYFRSRLEARWAVFFDELGLEYQYEPEGFDIDGEWYLPDFFLPYFNSWVEIKPTEDKFDFALKSKMAAISSHFQQPFLGIAGTPEIDNSYTVNQAHIYRSFILAGFNLLDDWCTPEFVVEDDSFGMWSGIWHLSNHLFYNSDILNSFKSFWIQEQDEDDHYLEYCLDYVISGPENITYSNTPHYELSVIVDTFKLWREENKSWYFREQPCYFEQSTQGNLCVFGQFVNMANSASDKIESAANAAKSYRFIKEKI